MFGDAVSSLEHQRENGLPRTRTQQEEELQARRRRCKQLGELRKNAIAIGDSETASSLKEQAEEQRRHIHRLEGILGVKHHPLTRTLSLIHPKFA